MSSKFESFESHQSSSEPSHETKTENLYDRVRNALKIPKPIDSAYLEAEKGGELRAVEEFNKDIEQMPKMPPRDSGSRLKKLLLTSTIGLVGATHTPQIEQATKRAAIVAEDTIDEARIRLELLKKQLSDLKFGGHLGRGAGQGVLGGGSQNEGFFNQGGRLGDRNAAYVGNFEKIHGKLSPEKTQKFLELVTYVDHNKFTKDPLFFNKTFLEIEGILGGVSDAEIRAAERVSGRLVEEIKGKLNAEELKSPIRVAFELSKHRTMYAREKANLSELLTSQEGNCEALTRMLLATVPQIINSQVGNKMEMAAQLYGDHVRFLVRANPEDSWEWIDGQQHGVLTLEELQGSIIVDPKDMINISLGLQKAPEQKDADIKKSAKAFGYATNSKLNWGVSDGRVPTKNKSSGEIPLRIDESKSASVTFEQGAAKQKQERIERYVEVNADFSNVSSEASQEAPPKTFPIPESVAIDAGRGGYLIGSFDDLTNATGVLLSKVQISYPEESAKTKLDLAPLSGSSLKELQVDEAFTEVEGAEQLNVSNLETASIGFSQRTLFEKIQRDADKLKAIVVTVGDGMSIEEQKQKVANMDAFLRSPELKALAQKMKNNYARVLMQYPFEDVVAEARLEKDGSWKHDGVGDYLTKETRMTLVDNKANPNRLAIPATVFDVSYVMQEGVDLSKVKELILMHDLVEDGKEVDVYDTGGHLDGEDTGVHIKRLPEFGLEKILAAGNPESVELVLLGDASRDVIDLSVLNNSSIKKVIIFIDENSEKPRKIIGISGKQIIFKTITDVAQR